MHDIRTDYFITITDLLHVQNSILLFVGII
jgi:hypothetical protein